MSNERRYRKGEQVPIGEIFTALRKEPILRAIAAVEGLAVAFGCLYFFWLNPEQGRRLLGEPPAEKIEEAIDEVKLEKDDPEKKEEGVEPREFVP